MDIGRMSLSLFEIATAISASEHAEGSSVRKAVKVVAP